MTLDEMLTQAQLDLPPTTRQVLQQYAADAQTVTDPRLTRQAQSQSAAELQARTRAALEAEEAKYLEQAEREHERAQRDVLAGAARTFSVNELDATRDLERQNARMLFELERATRTNNTLTVLQAADDYETILDVYEAAKLSRDADTIRHVGAVARARLKALAAAERAAAGPKNQSIGPVASAVSAFERDFGAWQTANPSAPARLARLRNDHHLRVQRIRRSFEVAGQLARLTGTNAPQAAQAVARPAAPGTIEMGGAWTRRPK